MNNIRIRPNAPALDPSALIGMQFHVTCSKQELGAFQHTVVHLVDEDEASAQVKAKTGADRVEFQTPSMYIQPGGGAMRLIVVLDETGTVTRAFYDF